MSQPGNDSSMRVALVCSSTLWAGTEKWALRAAEGLARRGHRVSFIARQPELFAERRAKDVESRANLTLSSLPLRNDADLFSVLRLANRLQDEADVVILTRVRDYWLGGLAARIAGIPVVLRLGVQRRLRDRYWRDRLRYGVWPAAILVNARKIKDVLAESTFIDPDKVHVIYNGADTPGPLPRDECAHLRAKLGVPEDALLVAGAGRLAAEKRWDWLLDALATTPETARGLDPRSSSGADSAPAPVHAVILGDGKERESLQHRIAELDLQDRVTLPGARSDAAAILGAADVAVMCSRLEGVANAMLEAMGQAVPVAATAAGGASERLVDERDLLLAGIDDKARFIENVHRLLHDPALRERLGAQGLDTVQQQFSWTRMSEQLEDLLRTVVSASS